MDLCRYVDVLETLRSLREERIPRRMLKDRSNPLEHLDDAKFAKRYRLSKSSTLELLDMVKEELSFPSRRCHAIPPHFRLLAALRFFASGHHQMTDGDLLHMNKSTVCRIVHKVSRAIAGRRKEFMKFPTTPQEIAAQMNAFYAEHQFPGVIGLVDGTHIRISNPGGDDGELYRNRKGFFSINAQLVCNADMEFTHIVARWSGSTHDSRVMDNSTVPILMGNNNGVLLGDSGYPCVPYLMTPILNPSSPAEKRYNKSHIGTRIKIERSFGVWKQRYLCLQLGLRTKLDNTLPIIVATACLHNYAIRRGEVDMTEEFETGEADDIVSTDFDMPQSSNCGLVKRRDIVNNHFS